MSQYSSPHPTAWRLELCAFSLTARRSARGLKPLAAEVLVEEVRGADRSARDGADQAHRIGEAGQAFCLSAFFQTGQRLSGPRGGLDPSAVDGDHDRVVAPARGERLAGSGREDGLGLMQLVEVVAPRALADGERERHDRHENRDAVLVEQERHARQHRAQQQDQHDDVREREYPFGVSEVDVEGEPPRDHPECEGEHRHEGSGAVPAPERGASGSPNDVAGPERWILNQPLRDRRRNAAAMVPQPPRRPPHHPQQRE